MFRKSHYLGFVATLTLISACVAAPYNQVPVTTDRFVTPAANNLPTPTPETEEPDGSRQPTSSDFTPVSQLRTCDDRSVGNDPGRNAMGYLSDYRPFITVAGEVTLAMAPVDNACLSSGFGPRARSIHKGIDLAARRNGVKINPDNRAAGHAIVLEAKYHRAFGHYVLLAHGKNVFTRYAHLGKIYDGIKPGAHIALGTPLGPMGASGNARGAHLHFEVLVGNYDTTKVSYGLRALDPFEIAKLNTQEERHTGGELVGP